MNLSVIGLGKLGLCTALCFANAGFKVWGVDLNINLIEKIKKGIPPFYEPELEDFLKKAKNFFVSSDHKEAVKNSDVVFIIVPTPSKQDGSFSNDFILKVFDEIGPTLKSLNRFVVIDVVSTVIPGAGESELIPYLEKVSEKKVGKNLGYVYNPEFIAIGSVIRDFLNPDIVLIGESDKRSGDIIESIYKKVCRNNPYIARTSIINAEIAKLSINCFCTMKISFANYLSQLLDEIPGASAKEVTSIIGKDSRIGTKYISPGLGFGGPCFPRDNQAFIRFAKKYNKEAKLQEAVIEINRTQLNMAIEKISKEIKRKNPDVIVALLGLAYKPYTYLTEESQQLEIAKNLAKNKNIKLLKVYDPLVKENYGWINCNSLEECVKDADIIAVLTPYPEFVNVEKWKNFIKPNAKIINFWS